MTAGFTARLAALDVAPATLSVEAVSFGYGGRRVLDGLSLTVLPGGVTCLLGPSGCGKSTLLRIIAGLANPSDGTVLLDGTPVTGRHGSVPPERRRVGLMFQDYALFPHLSVLDNVLFGLSGRPGARDIAIEALRRVRLERLGSAYPGQLSGGEQQRAALARALAPQPRVLLMDEPFSNLDRSLRDRIGDETIATLAEFRITTLIVTHDPDEALALADRIVLMSDGRVVQAGTGEELYRRPVSLTAARALSAVNEIPGRFAGGRLLTPVGAFDAAQPGPEGSAGILCVRPEAVRIGADGMPGRVLRDVFRGPVQLALVSVEGLALPLRAISPRPEQPVAGTAVTIDPEGAHVFLA